MALQKENLSEEGIYFTTQTLFSMRHPTHSDELLAVHSQKKHSN